MGVFTCDDVIRLKEASVEGTCSRAIRVRTGEPDGGDTPSGGDDADGGDERGGANELIDFLSEAPPAPPPPLACRRV